MKPNLLNFFSFMECTFYVMSKNSLPSCKSHMHTHTHTHTQNQIFSVRVLQFCILYQVYNKLIFIQGVGLFFFWHIGILLFQHYLSRHVFDVFFGCCFFFFAEITHLHYCTFTVRLNIRQYNFFNFTPHFQKCFTYSSPFAFPCKFQNHFAFLYF